MRLTRVKGSKNNGIRFAAASLLVFSYLFHIPIFSGESSFLRSSYIALVIALLYLAFRPQAFSIILKITSLRNAAISVVLAGFLLIYTWVVFFARGIGDASFPLMMTRSIVWIVGSAVVYAVTKDLYPEHIINVLIATFVAQSMIIDLSMISPEFKVLTDQFRSEGIVLKGQQYGGYRGLAVAGSSFYAMAICYAMMYYLIAVFWREWRVSSSLLKVLLVVIMAIAGISAGRTAIIGFVPACIVIFYRLIADMRTKDVSRALFVVPTVCLLLGIAVYAFLPSVSSTSVFANLLRFASSAFSDFGYGVNNLDSTSSFSFLKMYFPLSPEQLIVGDGLYMIDDHYYMRTDAGYMRPILYFGVFGLALMVMLQFALLSPCKATGNKLILGGIFVLLLVLQLKGEAMLVAASLSIIVQMIAMELGIEEASSQCAYCDASKSELSTYDVC